MTDRSRRLLIGFGLMFGLQFIVAWVARTWFGIVGGSYNIVGLLLIFTVAIYFGGGLAMGLLSHVTLHNPAIDVLAVGSFIARVQVLFDRYQGLLRQHIDHDIKLAAARHTRQYQ